MNSNIFKKLIPYLVALILFTALPYIYLSPLIEGKVVNQMDVNNFKGMSKEIVDYRNQNNEEALWTNSMFGGMPAYLISTIYKSNLFKSVFKVLKFAKRPADMLFLMLLCFFILLICLKVDPWLSIIGAFAFAFSSYNLIILEVGHNSKADAIAFFPLIVAGFILIYQRKWLWGFILSSLAITLELIANHLQITYYALITLLILGLFYLYNAFVEKEIKKLIISSSILILAALLAVGVNFSQIWTVYEYGKYSTRGKSELSDNEEIKTKGLDKDYATDWSYGVDETFTLLIPNFKGGSSGGQLSTNSNTYELFKNAQGAGYAKQVIKSLPLYWGTQPFTSGPVYVGAFILFLFVFGIFILKGTYKWWLIIATIVSVVLSWGDNIGTGALFRLLGIGFILVGGIEYLISKRLMKISTGLGILFIVISWILPNAISNYPFNYLVLDYLPGYNKFRTVSMALVIAGFTIPLMAILALKEIVSEQLERKELVKKLMHSLYIVGGVCLFFILFGGSIFNFSSARDAQQLGEGQLLDAIIADRKSLFQTDALRSLLFILLGLGTILLFLYKKINKTTFIILTGLIVLIDLWTIDKRYLNNDDFISERKAEVPFLMTNADQIILKDTDPDFRVLNVAVNTFNDASTSYYHKSIGGYHGAKMKRYQELIDFHISKNNMDVLNMLNTKYFIVPTKDQGPVAQLNFEALGNAWFVDQYKIVENADEEIEALGNFNPGKEVIIDKRWNGQIEGFEFAQDSSKNILLEEYQPNYLKYEYISSVDQIVVFSEIFYDKGWNAYIDGEKHDHFRCNYVLRGMVVPAGEHVIEFIFEPKSFVTGSTISLASSIVLLLLILVVFFVEAKKYLKMV